MDGPRKTSPEQHESAIHNVHNCAMALRNVVQDNFAPGSSARSERETLVLLEIERVASMLEAVILQADGQVGPPDVGNSPEDGVELTDDDHVDPDDLIPFDYDPEVEGPEYKTKWEHFEEEGVLFYDSDDSGKF